MWNLLSDMLQEPRTTAASTRRPTMPIPLRIAAVDIAAKADVVLFFGGLNKNYTQDCEGDDRRSYNLPFGQDKLIKEIIEATPHCCNNYFRKCRGNAVAR